VQDTGSWSVSSGLKPGPGFRTWLCFRVIFE
jgi:hypothetical protein